ncbi:MAG TPA: glycosyltransferase family 1 protein [Anaerolineaceae bacterium]|nr:glycosyltransferase family 1 protein [Anaerolineaceae bacterium]
MNIALISYHTCPLATLGGKDTGGMNVYVRDLTRYLGEIGIHADVFTRSQDEHVPHVLHDLGFGNRIVHIPAGPETPLPKEELYKYVDVFTDNIIEFATSKNITYDLIHSHYWLSGLAALKLREKWNVPILQMFHTLAHLKNQIARSPAERESPLRLASEKKVIAEVDRIIAATEIEKDQLLEYYNASSQKINIVPPGVDLTRFYPIPQDEAKAVIGIPPNEKVILFVGRIEPLKGIDNLLKSIAFLRRSNVLTTCPHYVAIIGGDPDRPRELLDREMRHLQDLNRRLGLDDMVVFLGKKAQDSLPYYYSASEVVVMPSHYESFGMVALEAMACGTPVIATRVGGLKLLVNNGVTGLSVPDDDPQALAKQLMQILCEQGLRAKLRQNGLEFARNYSWSIITDALVKIYQDMLFSNASGHLPNSTRV